MFGGYLPVKKKLTLVLAVVMALTMCLSFASCGKEGNKLVVGVDNAFPPMGFVDDNGNLTGFDIELAQAVGKKLNYEVEIQAIDWKRKQQELDAGNVDCLWNGYTITEDRLEACTISEPYMKNRQIIAVKAGSDIASLDDLKGKKLALQSESSASDALDSKPEFKASLGQVLLYDDNNQALLDLEAGGVDAVLLDEVVANYHVKEDGKIVALDLSLADEEYGIGFRKADTELCEKVENALHEMKEDGSLAQLSIKWFGKDVTTVK